MVTGAKIPPKFNQYAEESKVGKSGLTPPTVYIPESAATTLFNSVVSFRAKASAVPFGLSG